MIIKSEKVLWQHILWVNVLTLIPAIILLIEEHHSYRLPFFYLVVFFILVYVWRFLWEKQLL